MKYGVTKKYALCFLIEALGLAGIAAEQEELGSNTIYFGDEVRQPPYTSRPLPYIPHLLWRRGAAPRRMHTACTCTACAPVPVVITD